MPKEGFATVTVNIETHKLLKAFAEKTHRSVPQVIEYLVEEAKKVNNPKEAKTSG